MYTEDLPSHAPGEYVPYGQRSYYSPDELPPEINLDLDDEFSRTLQDAIYHLGRLDGIANESDSSPLLYTTLVRREAVESVLLEGAEIKLEDVFRSDELGSTDEVKKDVREALNYETVIQQGVDSVSKTGQITLELLKDLHEELLDGVRGECDTPGQFRQSPVHIPSPDPAQKPFVPPIPGKVPDLMTNLHHYLVTESEYHDLIDLGIVHYQFETIHPFGDGNGRLGRILITLQLVRDGYLSEPYLYPSAYFNEHKVEYARRMRAVSERGEWKEWIRFFVEGVKEQAKEAVERTEELRRLKRRYESQYGHGKTAADRLALRLFEQPYLTTSDASDLLGMSDQTARNAIQELVSDGILVEVTGKQRYREFKAVEIFDVLDRPLN
jgi:Fic family protein